MCTNYTFSLVFCSYLHSYALSKGVLPLFRSTDVDEGQKCWRAPNVKNLVPLREARMKKRRHNFRSPQLREQATSPEVDERESLVPGCSSNIEAQFWSCPYVVKDVERSGFSFNVCTGREWEIEWKMFSNTRESPWWFSEWNIFHCDVKNSPGICVVSFELSFNILTDKVAS